MRMPKTTGKLRPVKRADVNLSASINAARASAAMYDELTNQSLRLMDTAITAATNSEIRVSAEEGELVGIEASRVNPETGSFEGYINEPEVFKWDVAVNKAAKSSFEANVSTRAMSMLKQVAAEADGDVGVFNRISKEIMSRSVSGLVDEGQQKYSTNEFAKAYNQLLPGVMNRGRTKQGELALNGWKDGQKVFRNDIGVTMKLYFKAQDEYRAAESDGDTESMSNAEMDMQRYKEQFNTLKTRRYKSAEGGIELGVLNVDGVYVDVEDAIFEGRKDATVEYFRSTEDYVEKQMIRKSVVDASDDELSPMRKSELLKVLDDELAHENAMVSAEYTQMTRERDELTRDANNALRTGILDLWASHETMSHDEFVDWQDEITANINEFYGSGYLSQSERENYITMLRNGDVVAEDDATVYGEFLDNLEEYDLEDITTNQFLTFQTKKELTAKWIDQNENEQWMKSPAYREGKDRIREAFGFYEKSILPQSLTHTQERQRKEMTAMIEAYRTQVRETIAAGEQASHYDIVSSLLDKARGNEYSSIVRSDRPYEGKVKTYADIKADVASKGATFEKLVSDYESLGGRVEEGQMEKDIKLLNEKEK